MGYKFEGPYCFGEKAWKLTNDLFDLSDLEIQDGCLKINGNYLGADVYPV